MKIMQKEEFREDVAHVAIMIPDLVQDNAVLCSPVVVEATPIWRSRLVTILPFCIHSVP